MSVPIEITLPRAITAGINRDDGQTARLSYDPRDL